MPPKTSSTDRPTLQQYWHIPDTTGIIARATLRTAQFTTAVIALGLYASSLHNLRQNHPATPLTNEIYALVVSTLSILTVAIHCLLTVKRVPCVLWDLVVSVLWAALAGRFGEMYLGGGVVSEEDRGRDIGVMKVAVAFDLCCLMLWLLSVLQGSVWCCCCARRFVRRTDGAVEGEERGDVEACERGVVEGDWASEAETLCEKTLVDGDEKKRAK